MVVNIWREGFAMVSSFARQSPRIDSIDSSHGFATCSAQKDVLGALHCNGLVRRGPAVCGVDAISRFLLLGRVANGHQCMQGLKLEMRWSLTHVTAFLD